MCKSTGFDLVVILFKTVVPSHVIVSIPLIGTRWDPLEAAAEIPAYYAAMPCLPQVYLIF